MKVSTLVELPAQEIDVHVGIDDIRAALCELSPADGYFAVTQLLNNVAVVLKSISEEQIALLSSGGKKVVAGFLREQLNRFAETEVAE